MKNLSLPLDTFDNQISYLVRFWFNEYKKWENFFPSFFKFKRQLNFLNVWIYTNHRLALYLCLGQSLNKIHGIGYLTVEHVFS
ncbi:hypothetical protein DDT91_18005 [Algoriphagus sp. AK58]|nr:hypothetical protein [Algoriphagus sp. AK58]